ncbi:hypothetical protein D3C76_1292650 [compost metagenome]
MLSCQLVSHHFTGKQHNKAAAPIGEGHAHKRQAKGFGALFVKATHRPGSIDADDKWPTRLLVKILMNDRALTDFLAPGLTVQAIGQELFLHQPTVEFIFQLGDAQRRQLRRQKAQDIIALLQAVDLFRHRRRFAHQGAEGLHRRIFLRH